MGFKDVFKNYHMILFVIKCNISNTTVYFDYKCGTKIGLKYQITCTKFTFKNKSRPTFVISRMEFNKNKFEKKTGP